VIDTHVKNDAVLSGMRHLSTNGGATASEKGPQPAEEMARGELVFGLKEGGKRALSGEGKKIYKNNNQNPPSADNPFIR